MNDAVTARARFDDLRTGVGIVLDEPFCVRTADELDEVRPLVAEAERHARAGAWVALVVAYEAGPAFDSAQRTHPCPPGVPLAWFGAFRRATHGGAIAASPRRVEVHGLARRGGWDWYGDGVDEIREIIASGSAYQINLTDRLEGRLEGRPADLYARMAHAQRGRFNALVELGDTSVISASPELFFEANDRSITSRPMKGTSRRGLDVEGDALAADRLTSSEKDRAENVMITDLLRNDIGRIARTGTVRVPSLLCLERYETVWQLTSTVTGEIPDELGLVEMFDALFPCGSITGAPKVSAMQHIRQLEPWPRGVYCGTIGLIRPIVDGAPRPRSTFSVAIRTAVVQHADGALIYGAGGGITYDSSALAENRELEAKSAVLTAHRPTFQLLETMYADRDGIRHLDRHLARLTGSAHYFDFDIDAEHIGTLAASLVEGVDRPHRVRLLLDRHGCVTTTFDPLDDHVGPSANRLAVCLAARPVNSRDPLMVHKTTARERYDAISSEHPEVDDVLLWNHDGEVVESCRANVLFRLGDRWHTPPRSSGGLPGVARAALIDAGLVDERVLPVDQLHAVDELQLVSSLRGRRPARLVPA